MNVKALYDKMRERGVTVGGMCELLGISRSAFYRRTRGISEFTLSEIQRMREVLELSTLDEIFFAQKVS